MRPPLTFPPTFSVWAAIPMDLFPFFSLGHQPTPMTANNGPFQARRTIVLFEPGRPPGPSSPDRPLQPAVDANWFELRYRSLSSPSLPLFQELILVK
jgi:hypothetical protein